MNPYPRLRFEDVRNVFRLLGEARKLGSEPRRWREHVLRGLLRLTDGSVGFSAIEVNSLAGTPTDLNLPVDVGWKSDRERQAYLDFLRGGQIVADPVFPFLRANLKKSFTCLRREIVNDATWYRSETVQNYHRRGGCDDIIYSRRILPHLKCADMLTLRGRWGGRSFSDHDRQMVALFHDELARLWRQQIKASRARLAPAALPRHLQVLAEQFSVGSNEKEAARALNLSGHTVHTYAKSLYRRMHVHSRSELLSLLNAGYDFIPRLVYSPVSRNIPKQGY